MLVVPVVSKNLAFKCLIPVFSISARLFHECPSLISVIVRLTVVRVRLSVPACPSFLKYLLFWPCLECFGVFRMFWVFRMLWGVSNVLAVFRMF